MAFRDEDEARRARIASLEARAAEADRLAEENRALRERVRALEGQLPERTPAPAVPRFAAPPPLDLPELAEWTALDDWAQAVDAARALAADASAPRARRVAALHAAAWIAEVRLGEPSRAAELHDEVLELDPLDARALEQSLRLAEASERWTRVAALREQLAELAPDAPTRLAHLLALATVCEDQLADSGAALAALRRALAIDPAHAAALTLAARLAR